MGIRGFPRISTNSRSLAPGARVPAQGCSHCPLWRPCVVSLCCSSRVVQVHRLRELVFQGRGRGSLGGARAPHSSDQGPSSSASISRSSTRGGLAAFVGKGQQGLGEQGGKGERWGGGEGEGQRRRREKEEERERRKGRERELERIHWALPALTRLQSRLTALQFVHSPSNATPGSALLLLALVEFYCDAEEEGLPHLLPALTAYTTLLLPRHLHDEGVAEATLDFFLLHAPRIKALDAAFMPEVSLLLLKAFACHIPRLEAPFIRLLPHLVAPSSALQLTAAALDLPGTPLAYHVRSRNAGGVSMEPGCPRVKAYPVQAPYVLPMRVYMLASPA